MSDDIIRHLRSLPAIRERCSRVFSLAERGELEFWTLDLSRESAIVDFVCSLISRDYGEDYDSIPPHGRWRHFVGNRVDPLLSAWEADQTLGPLEVARRMVDLMVVSVLMDAGAGNAWKYKPKDGGEPIARSEGLAIGSLEMFERGMFSDDPSQPHQVNALGLSRVSPADIAKAMQVSESNPMDGIEGRAGLLVRLGSVLADQANSKYFRQGSSCRPGHLIDYLLTHPSSQQTPSPSSVKMAVKIDTLWEVVIEGLKDVWPAARTKIDGVSLGDVWPCQSLRASSQGDADALVPFHKLSQWLTYSLIEVMERIMGWTFIGKEAMTGLPEYRNDYGLLKPNIPALLRSFGHGVPPQGALPDLLALPGLPASHSAIVEFRAVTVIMLDRLADGIRQKTGVPTLTLPQVLEAGTWKAGREIAKTLRPETGGPPLNVVLDGTVF